VKPGQMDTDQALPNPLSPGASNLLASLGVAVVLGWMIRLVFIRSNLQELREIISGRVVAIPRVGRLIMDLEWWSRDHLRHFLSSAAPAARRTVPRMILNHRLTLLTSASVADYRALTQLRVRVEGTRSCVMSVYWGVHIAAMHAVHSHGADGLHRFHAAGGVPALMARFRRRARVSHSVSEEPAAESYGRSRMSMTEPQAGPSSADAIPVSRHFVHTDYLFADEERIVTLSATTKVADVLLDIPGQMRTVLPQLTLKQRGRFLACIVVQLQPPQHEQRGSTKSRQASVLFNLLAIDLRASAAVRVQDELINSAPQLPAQIPLPSHTSLSLSAASHAPQTPSASFTIASADLAVSSTRSYVTGDAFGLERGAEEDCVVCLTNRKDMILLPCRHLCVCSSCFSHITQCPVCRTPADSNIKVLNGHDFDSLQ
jgi:hypothetical protein